MYVFILQCSISAQRRLCTYHGQVSQLRPLRNICGSVRFNSVQCRLVPSGGIPFISVQPSDVFYHLVAVCGTATQECDSTDALIVRRRVLLLFLLFIQFIVKAVIRYKNYQFKLCDTGDDQPYVFHVVSNNLMSGQGVQQL